AVGALMLNVAIAVHRPMHAAIGPRVLVFDVPSEVDEGPPPPTLTLDLLRRERPTFQELLFAMRNAAEDRSVTGVVLHVDGLDWSWARVHEMASAVRGVRGGVGARRGGAFGGARRGRGGKAGLRQPRWRRREGVPARDGGRTG